MTLHTQTVEPVRFFDGGMDGLPPDPLKPAEYALLRDISSGKERFQLVRRLGYRRRGTDGQADVFIVVPHNLKNWRTDFASIPWLFAWLVPRSGNHLPAAILHDGLIDGDFAYLIEKRLVCPGSALPSRDGVTPESLAPGIPRDEADAVLNEAMGDLGTGVVRRWLMWTAVTLATLFKLRTRHGRTLRGLWYCAAVATTAIAVIVLGALATANVAATAGVEAAAFVRPLPWMGAESVRTQLLQGLAGAVVIPAALSLLWGRFWRAGLIAGIALAALLHVTVAVAALTLVYLSLESLGRVNEGRVLLWLLLLVAAAALGGFVLGLSR